MAAIAAARSGDTLTLVLENSLTVGGTPAISIPSGIAVVMTNQSGVAVTVSRVAAGFGATSRIDIFGSLTVREDTSGGGSLTFNGGGSPCMGNPQFAANAGSALTIESGTIERQRSEYGAIYSADGAALTVNGGTLRNNRSDWQGGVIWAANCNVTINGGTFSENTSATIGGAIYYEGRFRANKLLVTGGTFHKNVANGGFGGGAIFIFCDVGGVTVAEITGGTFTENSASTAFGGAIYTQEGSEVKIKNPVIYKNRAGHDGGGIWNCGTGVGNYYAFHGVYLAENTAGDQGGDFYSLAKEPRINGKVYLTDYTFSGEKCNWKYDDGTAKDGTPAPNDYYQDSAAEIALKSGLSGTTGAASVYFSENSALYSGGAIANNGMLEIGEATALAVEKVTTSATTERFQFQVRLTKNGVGMPGSFIYRDSGSTTLGHLVFDANGLGTLSLEAGQTVTILDLPVGTHFTVTETGIPAGWILRSPNNVSGNVSGSARVAPVTHVAFTNGLDTGGDGAAPKTGDPNAPGLWCALLVLSILGMLLNRRRKKRSAAEDGR